MQFEIDRTFTPKGDQAQAIEKLVKGLAKPGRQTLLGVTGSGKTFTIANVIAQVKKPTLILAHNKTLAAQLYAEFCAFFPKNAVRYFVSYYDYYQPESYLPGRDVYIEKDAQINDKIEQLRIAATSALISRQDVIVVASVSCIYGLGDPKNWYDMTVRLHKGQKISRKKLIEDLINIQYERNNTDFTPGHLRVQGDTIDIRDGPTEEFIRIQLFGDEVEKLSRHHYITGNLLEDLTETAIFPAKHYLIKEEQKERAIKAIREELENRLPELPELERQRLASRTKYDLEMIEELGYCKGIENYSRHFDDRKVGEPPYTLIDFFPKDFLLVIDESHVTLPQVHGMQAGDYSRKKALVDYGFRLPCAYDNRPLKFEEFDAKLSNVVYVSATPGDYEIKESKQVVEQIIRPTGLVDPQIEVRGTKDQIEDLYKEIEKTKKQGFRTLVTTLTKKMAEDLSEYFAKKGLKVRYLHSEIDTLERTEIIRQLRLKTFDCLIGINLMREGLDIPEVALVAILDADKEGFLRNTRSLVQTIGRAARNSEGRVILYADKETPSMKMAIEETNRRRDKQIAYNKTHKITPKTIIKSIAEGTGMLKDTKGIPRSNIPELIIELTEKMELAAEELKFEDAILLRNQIIELEKRLKDKT